jgi:sugar/nucleoside kinase (ribokinase family)
MEKRFDVFGMCNALFDIQAEVNDTTLEELKVAKGGMMLISHEEQRAIVPQVYEKLVHTEAGGSGANTMIGIALLGGKACYTSRIGKDDHGRRYRDGLAAQGIQPNLGEGDGDTGISLILVTPDTQRTMCTYLGMAQDLQANDISIEDIQSSRYIYVTGYLWDTENQKEAVLRAMDAARDAGDVKISLSLSDPFCVGRHKEDFLRLLGEYVDVVFANEQEAIGLTDETDMAAAARKLSALCRNGKGIAAVTKDRDGSLLFDGETLHAIPVYPVSAVDTTGAGDMYAAGVLYGLTQNLSLPVAGRIGSYAAAQVVAKLGPRLPSIDKEALEVITKDF